MSDVLKANTFDGDLVGALELPVGNAVKRGLDIFIAISAIVLLLPLLLLVALSISLQTRGPVLFRHRRIGFNGRSFECLKFKTMADDGAQRLRDYFNEHPEAESEWIETQKLRDDPRVTAIGSLLRKTSLDELPQLFNVVFGGTLSLVGPRPHAFNAKAEDKLYDEAVDGYFARHRVKPGITGWAQINGWRGETDTQEKIQRRVEHDLYYIENWSVLFDLYILLKTPFALLKTENAY
jgi:lipopolysaccharide/colanic/teichoic acid biosynthesis glycosyltransferase